jgi:hypothetical protein
LSAGFPLSYRASAFTFSSHLWRIFCGKAAKNRAFRGFRRSLPCRKSRPEKLQSNFVSVFAQNGRSRPYNPLRPTGFKKWFNFGTGSIIKTFRNFKCRGIAIFAGVVDSIRGIGIIDSNFCG